MTNKVEQIERKVRHDVTDTVETVKQTFDVRRHIEERPWTAVGAALLVGYMLGSADVDLPDVGAMVNDVKHNLADVPGKISNNGMIASIADQFGDELQVLKAAAVTAGVTMLRDVVKQQAPALGREMERLKPQSTIRSAVPAPHADDLRSVVR